MTIFPADELDLVLSLESVFFAQVAKLNNRIIFCFLREGCVTVTINVHSHYLNADIPAGPDFFVAFV